jgi:hypothetical protein
LEYDFYGKFVRSIPIPVVERQKLSGISHAGDSLFIGNLYNTGKNEYKYCLFDRNGVIVKSFPNYIFFDRVRNGFWTFDFALEPARVGDRLYLKDYVTDTIYSLTNSTLQPAFVFDLGKYTFPKQLLETMNIIETNKLLIIRFLLGTPKYFFYELQVPENLPTPKIQPVRYLMTGNLKTREERVYGIYNIETNTNLLLDINENLYSEKGIINDLNGGLPFFPSYYAGNNILIDIWDAETMKEILTNEYFSTRQIKDQAAHQKLKELLKNLKADDNPVIVIAKLK